MAAQHGHKAGCLQGLFYPVELYPALGAVYAPHGVGCAMMLPIAMEFN